MRPPEGHHESSLLTQVSSDPYTDGQAQHATEVEPDIFTATAIPVAAANSGTTFHLAMYTPTGGLPISGGALSRPAR